MVRFLKSSLVCLLALACVPERRSPAERLELLLIRPKNPNGVYLNEPLSFDFSDEIDPASVTSRSLSILAPDGTRARGELYVEGDRVRFEPAPVLSPDYADGGYRPGATYSVTLQGFPAPDGITTRRGVPLASTVRWSFTTAAPGRSVTLFVDDSPERCSPLYVLTNSISPGGAILLGCDEALDPKTIHAEDFLLWRESLGGDERVFVPLRARLIQNRAGGVHPGTAVLELAPRLELPSDQPYLGEGPRPRHKLELLRGLRVADFSGNVAPVAEPRQVTVAVNSAKARPNEYRESFLSAQRRLPVPIVGVDGTAYWGKSGAVTVRYPAAAGLGTDGRVTFGQTSGRTLEGLPLEDREDVHATHARVGAAGCTLRAEPGLVVLRAQGRLEVTGPLIRRTQAPPDPIEWDLHEEPGFRPVPWILEAFAPGSEDPAAPGWRALAARLERDGDVRWSDVARALDRPLGEGPTWKDLVSWIEKAPETLDSQALATWAEDCRAAPGARLSLSRWLEIAASQDRNWTVVVAGADLVVRGPIDVDTPLLIVSGGLIRIQGEVRARGPIHMLGEGGGAGVSRAPDPELDLDPPKQNPLREPITYGVLSKQIPRDDGPIVWSSADELGSLGGLRDGGELSVHYVKDVSPAGFDPAQHTLYDDPSLMDEPGPVHFLIRITLPARTEDVAIAPSWNPPILDEIILISEP